MSVAADEIGAGVPAAQLRTGALGVVEIVGQSLAAIAPTLTPALNISVVAGLAGTGCWMAYFMVFGMGDDTATLGASAAPFGDVAVKAGLGWASMIVYLAAMISVFACCLASITAAARLLFSMGKYKFLHRSMGLVHDTHRTPYRAILFCGCLLATVCVAMLPAGFLNAFGYAGTFASFGFVVVYLMLCIVAPLDLHKTREIKPHHVLLGILGTALMSFVIFGSVFPIPAYPYNILPYAFFAHMVAGALWFAVLKAKSPQTLASIQHDLEG